MENTIFLEYTEKHLSRKKKILEESLEVNFFSSERENNM